MHRRNHPPDIAMERRFLQGAQIRVVSPDSRTIRGYGVVFNRESLIITERGRRFKEIIRPEAAARVNLSRVLCMHNHNMNRLLGNTEAGTMRVGVDETGIWYETDLPDSPTGEDVLQSVSRGDTRDSSFQFTITDKGDRWEMREGTLYREVVEFDEIAEMGPVTEGAYPDTTVAARLMDRATRDLTIEVVTATTDAKAEETWTLGYIIDNSAWALERANSMIGSLNNWISYYEYYAGEKTRNAPVFQALADDCRAAKTALVQLIDGHATAIKALNAAENRSKAPANDNTEPGSDFPQIDFRLRELEAQL